MHNDATLAAYEAAVAALTPLPRAVFLMYRVDELPYRQIATRLGLDIPEVEACIAHAICTIARLVDGDAVGDDTPELIATAEARLFERFRASLACRTRLWSFDAWLRDSPPATIASLLRRRA